MPPETDNMRRGSESRPGSHLQQNFALDDDPAVFRAALAESNGFTNSQLTANRSGRIAFSQYPSIILEAFRPALYSGVVLLGWVFVLYFRDLMLPQAALDLVRRAWSFFLVITLATAAAFLLGLVRSAKLGWLVILDLKDGEVDTVAGRVSTYRTSREELGVSALFSAKAEHYYYWIGDLKLEVTPSGYELLVKRYDQQYCPPIRIYFTPRSLILLSAEPTLAMKKSQPSIWLKGA